MLSDRQLKFWYDKYNTAYFEGKLPVNTIIYWEPPPAAHAETCRVFETDHQQFIVRLDPSHKGNKNYWRLLILHEMVHIKLWPKHPKSQHGKLFQQEMLSLAERGAFKTLW